MSTVFVFSPDASYGLIDQIRHAGVMPAPGLRYVASVTGPWKIVKIMSFDDVSELAPRLEAVIGGQDPPTAMTMAASHVRHSRYRTHTAFVRIDTDLPDPAELRAQIGQAIGTEGGDEVEADVVIGDFDLFVCVVDDDESELNRKLLRLRQIAGVRRTVSLRVMDFVSTSDGAQGSRNWVEAAEETST